MGTGCCDYIFMKNKKVIVFVISAAVILVVAGGSFYAGFSFGKKNNSRARFLSNGMPSGFDQNFSGRNGGTGSGAGNGFGGGVNGEITGVIGNSIVVQQRDGSKTTVDVSEATISKLAEGSISDLSIGTNVTVSGSSGTNGGDFSAKTVQIRPALNNIDQVQK